MSNSPQGAEDFALAAGDTVFEYRIEKLLLRPEEGIDLPALLFRHSTRTNCAGVAPKKI